MAKGKRTGAAHKGYYANYKASKTWSKNRQRRLAKQLVLFPENEQQLSLAIKNIAYRRKTPTTRVWSSTTKRAAKLFKKFSGTCPSLATLQGTIRNKTEEEKYWKEVHQVKAGFLLKTDKAINKRSMFSLAERLA